MSQNLLEVVENLHAAISANPDCTNDNKAIIQALQHALDQKKKKKIWFDRQQ
jgi:molecular chaperone GrpE (heat shock protein)